MDTNFVSDAVVIDIPGELIRTPNGLDWLRIVVKVSDAETLYYSLKEHFGYGQP